MSLKILRAAMGLVVMLLAGFVYAWSVISAPIAADFPNWTNAQLSLTFTLCMAFFCLGGIFAGILSKKLPVRLNLAVSAVLFALGFYISSRAETLFTLYMGYGVICGLASGFSYNSVLNAIPRWFPDNQGLISGILLMGFGAGSMLIGAVFTWMTPASPGAWRNSLLTLGLGIAAIIALSILLITPPKSEIKPKASASHGLDLKPGQMMRRKSFWLMYLWMIIVSAVGLVVISQSRLMAGVSAPGMSAATVSIAVGLISVCNGVGRVIFGQLFDRLGHRRTMSLVGITLILGVLLLVLSVGIKSPALLVLGFMLSGAGYGGGPTMSAALIRRFYGDVNYPVNFSITNSSLLIASFSSTGAGMIYDKTAGFSLVFVILIAVSAVAWICGGMIKEA